MKNQNTGRLARLCRLFKRLIGKTSVADVATCLSGSVCYME